MPIHRLVLLYPGCTGATQPTAGLLEVSAQAHPWSVSVLWNSLTQEVVTASTAEAFHKTAIAVIDSTKQQSQSSGHWHCKSPWTRLLLL